MLQTLRPIASTSAHIFSRTPIVRNSIRFSSTISADGSIPVFHPTARTSAHTLIPYGNPALSSSAYLPTLPSNESTPTMSSTDSSKALRSDAATLETPTDLTPAQRTHLERIIRVDQAGELGANYIYMGQLAVLSRGKDQRVIDLVQHMWDGEKKHIATFDKIVSQHGVRPTFLYPIWKAAGFALGAGTAMMGKRAAMACTEAVETIIGEHYDDQLKSLSDPAVFPSNHPSIVLLKEILAEFRDDELEHLDTAIANDSQQAPLHAAMSAVIGVACKVAITATERI